MNMEFKIAVALFAVAGLGLIGVLARSRYLSPNGSHPVTMVVVNVSAVLALAGLALAVLAISASN